MKKEDKENKNEKRRTYRKEKNMIEIKKKGKSFQNLLRGTSEGRKLSHRFQLKAGLKIQCHENTHMHSGPNTD